MTTVAHIFFEVSMSNGHDGLTKKLGKIKLDVGETAIFINRRWTALKLLKGEVIMHVRSKHGINPAAIKYLPNCVEGKNLNYKKALEAAVLERFKKDNPNRNPEVVL